MTELRMALPPDASPLRWEWRQAVNGDGELVNLLVLQKPGVCLALPLRAEELQEFMDDALEVQALTVAGLVPGQIEVWNAETVEVPAEASSAGEDPPNGAGGGR